MNVKRLGELLVESGAISSLQLQVALSAQETSHRRLGEILVDKGFVTEEAIAQTLAEQYGYQVVDLSSVIPNTDALGLIGVEFALEHCALPLRSTDTDLEVALADPVDIVATDALAQATKRRLTVRVATRSSIETKVREFYGLNETPLKTPDDLPVPGRFGMLRARKSIGAALLFDAVDHELDRRVTLACLETNHPDERSLRRRVQSAARSPHPNVAAVYDWFEHEGHSWVVLERLDGETLSQILKTRGARTISQSAELAAAIADGVETLHAVGGHAGLVCAGNVLIRPNGPLLLPLDRPTAEYGSPEVEMGQKETALSDVFALGTLLWEMASGDNPHRSAGGRHRWSEPEPHESNLPGPLIETLKKALQKEPERRTQSARQLSKSLRALNWNLVSSTSGPASATSAQEREQLLASLDSAATGVAKRSFWSRLFGRAA